MNRQEALAAAEKIVMGERNDTYGSPEDSFSTIAQYWEQYLKSIHKRDLELHSSDVAFMMVLLKLARLQSKPNHEDSVVDAIGYLACYAEIITEIKIPPGAAEPG